MYVPTVHPVYTYIVCTYMYTYIHIRERPSVYLATQWMYMASA